MTRYTHIKVLNRCNGDRLRHGQSNANAKEHEHEKHEFLPCAPSPGVLGSSSAPFALWVPCRCLFCYCCFLLNSCVSSASCFVRSHELVLQIVFGQKTPRMRLRQWFMKVYSFVDNVSGVSPGFGAIQQHGFNAGVEDLKLCLE